MKRYVTVAIMLFSFFFIGNENDAFARKDLFPKTCAGYNKNGDVCVASCKRGETAICHNAQGGDQPNCYCESGNGDESLNGFLIRLNAELSRVGDNDLNFVRDIIVKSDIYPEGEEVVSVAAICNPPYPFLCNLKFANAIPGSSDPIW